MPRHRFAVENDARARSAAEDRRRWLDAVLAVAFTFAHPDEAWDVRHWW